MPASVLQVHMENPSIHANPHVLVYIYDEPNFNKDTALNWINSLGIPYDNVSAFSISNGVIIISFASTKENINRFVTAVNLTYSQTAYREFTTQYK